MTVNWKLIKSKLKSIENKLKVNWNQLKVNWNQLNISWNQLKVNWNLSKSIDNILYSDPVTKKHIKGTLRIVWGALH